MTKIETQNGNVWLSRLSGGTSIVWHWSHMMFLWANTGRPLCKKWGAAAYCKCKQPVDAA